MHSNMNNKKKCKTCEVVKDIALTTAGIGLVVVVASFTIAVLENVKGVEIE